MGNRKEQIANLEREIEQKTQTLNQLKEADENDENEEQEQTIEPNKADIDEFLSRI